MQVKIKRILHRLGGPTHVKGYQYTADAIMMAVEDRSFIDSITKGLYPAVAKKHNTTPSRVELNIHRFIETSWDRGDLDEQQHIFGMTVSPQKSKPTNSEFITMLADYILMGGE